MTDKEIIKNYVRSQWRLEGDLTIPAWIVGDKRIWWLEEANLIKQQNEAL